MNVYFKNILKMERKGVRPLCTPFSIFRFRRVIFIEKSAWICYTKNIAGK